MVLNRFGGPKSQFSGLMKGNSWVLTLVPDHAEEALAKDQIEEPVEDPFPAEEVPARKHQRMIIW
jgi:hypothetical protein